MSTNNLDDVKLSPKDEDSLICFMQLYKDMGGTLENLLIQLTDDYNNKVEYADSLDSNGNPLTLEVLHKCATELWDTTL